MTLQYVFPKKTENSRELTDESLTWKNPKTLANLSATKIGLQAPSGTSFKLYTLNGVSATIYVGPTGVYELVMPPNVIFGLQILKQEVPTDQQYIFPSYVILDVEVPNYQP